MVLLIYIFLWCYTGCGRNNTHIKLSPVYSTVIYEALCFDVAQGRLNGAPNETQTHSCWFASQAC